MLPSIALVLSVDMVRDGGSLAAVFQGTDSAEYMLLFPLRQRRLPSEIVERVGYGKPLIIERQTGVEIEMSWPHATVLINQIRPLVQASRCFEWLDAMSLVADTEGGLPPQIERFLRTV